MYKIKQLPEDFIVNEISNAKAKDKGRYAYFWLTKRDYTTIRAICAVADALKMPIKRFGYAGTKDKKAVTKQMVSVLGCSRERLERVKLKDVTIEANGYGDEPISLGELEGNEFEIAVRNIDRKPEKIERVKNYFGEQRFSRNNAEIGKLLVKRRFEEAVKMIASAEGDYEARVKEELETHANDYIGALRTIPKKILQMYVHAYQSLLWNRMAKKKKSGKAPIIGFGTEETKEIRKVLGDEGICIRNFVFNEIPELSSEGGERKVYSKVKNLEIGELEEDELNKGMKKCVVKFKLGKGSYATEAVKAMFY